MLILAWGIASFGASAANGACGDWLHHPARPADVITAESQNAAPNPDPIHPPCNGPGCRRGRTTEPPLTPTALPDRDLQERFVCSSMANIVVPGVHETVGGIGQIKSCRGYLPAIEHPPR